MGFLLSLRLVAWREIRARWILLATSSVIAASGFLFGEDLRAAWALFGCALVFPLLVLLAAGGPSSTDAFWKGLRPSPSATVLARVLVHLASALVPALLVLPRTSLYADNGPFVLILFGLVAVLVHGATLAARSLVSAIAVLAGPLVALGLFVLGTWLNAEVQYLPLTGSLVGRLVALSGLVYVLAGVWGARKGPWGAALTGTARAVLVPVVGFVLVNLAVELWPRMPSRVEVLDVSDDGRTALLLGRWDGAGRVWLWEDGRTRGLPLIGVAWGRLLPDSGSEHDVVLSAQPGPDHLWDRLDDLLHRETARPPTLTECLVGEALRCGPYPAQPGPRAGGLTVAEDGLIMRDGAEIGRLPPFDGENLPGPDSWTAQYPTGVGLFVVQGRQGARRLLSVSGSGVQPLAEGVGRQWGVFTLVPGGACLVRRGDDPLVQCWYDGGSLMSIADEPIVPISLTDRVNVREDDPTVTDLVFEDGLLRIPPGVDVERVAALSHDHVRAFYADGYRDVTVDGASSLHRY